MRDLGEIPEGHDPGRPSGATGEDADSDEVGPDDADSGDADRDEDIEQHSDQDGRESGEESA